MSSLPNYKARVQRANRNNVPVQSAFQSFGKIKWFTLFLVIIFPIYPSLAAIGNTSVTAVGDYDESSIIAAYTDSDTVDYVSENGMVTVNQKVTDPSTKKPTEQTSTPTPTAESVKTYTVAENDDVIKISKKYNIAPEVILWSNNLSMGDTLKVGQILKIPPVSGVVHVLEWNETISDLAAQYDISTSKILEVNNISDATKIRDGSKIMIPGAIRQEETPVQTPSDTADTAVKKPQMVTSEAKPAAKVVPKAVSSDDAPKPQKKVTVDPDTGLKSKYSVKFTGEGRGFAWGNCTWYVARNKNVTWRGNANAWMRNARAQGVPTGKTPVAGAIIQFSGHGYNSAYGHVGIVTEVTDDTIIISDMNYRGLNEVTIRKVSRNDPAIDGYIYVD